MSKSTMFGKKESISTPLSKKSKSESPTSGSAMASRLVSSSSPAAGGSSGLSMSATATTISAPYSEAARDSGLTFRAAAGPTMVDSQVKSTALFGGNQYGSGDFQKSTSLSGGVDAGFAGGKGLFGQGKSPSLSMGKGMASLSMGSATKQGVQLMVKSASEPSQSQMKSQSVVSQWVSTMSPFGSYRCDSQTGMRVSSIVWTVLNQQVQAQKMDAIRVKGAALMVSDKDSHPVSEIEEYTKQRLSQDPGFIGACYEVFEGRIYGEFSGSVFQIAVLESSQKKGGITEFTTFLEVKRTGGDSMLHGSLSDSIKQALTEDKIAFKCLGLAESPSADGSLAGPLSLTSASEDTLLSDIPPLSSAVADDLSDASGDTVGELPPLFGFDCGLDYEMSGLSFSDEDIEMAGGLTDAKEQIEGWYDTVCDKDSYQDVWQDAAFQLAAEVSGDATARDVALELLSAKPDALERLLSSVSGLSPTGDAFVCRSVLVICNELINYYARIAASESRPVGFAVRTVEGLVKEVQQFWQANPERHFGESVVRFMPSQQIEMQCDRALKQISGLV